MIRRNRTAYLVAVAGLSLALGACGATGTDDGDAADRPTESVQSPEPTEPGTTAPTDPGTTTPTEPETISPTEDDPVNDKPSHTRIPGGPGDQPLPTGPVSPAVLDRPDVQEAIAAEAERAGVDEDAVGVAGFADVTWTDGSIGCPQDGMMYTQALVPGYQLILEVDGRLASYHAAKDKPFSYCADPIPPAPPGSSGGLMTSDS